MAQSPLPMSFPGPRCLRGGAGSSHWPAPPTFDHLRADEERALGIGDQAIPPSVRFVTATTDFAHRPALALAGHIGRTDVDRLCDEVRAVLSRAVSVTERLDVDVTGLARPDVAAVDALARVQLTARRLGLDVTFCGACPELVELVRLAGLCGVLALEARSGIETRGKPEEREEPLRIEEERDP